MLVPDASFLSRDDTLYKFGGNCVLSAVSAVETGATTSTEGNCLLHSTVSGSIGQTRKRGAQTADLEAWHDRVPTGA